MSAWTLKRYQKMCEGFRADAEAEYQDMLGSDELWFDAAQMLLENEEGLKEFIRDRIGATDFKGCLADDLAYPGNCKSYVLKPVKKPKRH